MCNDVKINIFDSHAHYDDEAFNEDVEVVIKDIKEKGVIGVMNCGSSLKACKSTLELSKRYEMFYAALGIHPENANEWNEDVYKWIKSNKDNPKLKAIGEIGLDYYWEENPHKDIQKKVFREQMQLAKEMKLPVIIHDRDAHKDTLDIIKEFPEVKGVLHCFSGSVEFARECLKEGYYLGFTGVVTFKNAKKVIEVVKDVPLDKILVETDAPYMAPVPYRGKRNQSDYIEHIIKRISEIKDLSIEEISHITIRNTKALFNIK